MEMRTGIRTGTGMETGAETIIVDEDRDKDSSFSKFEFFLVIIAKFSTSDFSDLYG